MFPLVKRDYSDMIGKAMSAGSGFRGRFEGQRDRVHAVAVAGRCLRRVVEQVAEVGVAGRAADFGADHAEAAVLDETYGVALARVVERRPPAVGVELGVGPEQLGPAGAAAVDADALLLEQRAGPRSLGRRLAQDGVLIRLQLGMPFLVGLLHPWARHRPIVPREGRAVTS